MNIVDSVFVYRLMSSAPSATPGAAGAEKADRLSWHGRYHAHGASEYEIHFFLEGSGSFLCNRTRYPISGSRLFLTGPREFHSILPEAVASPLTYYAVLFSLSESEDRRLVEALRLTLNARATVLSVDPGFRFQFEDLLQMAKSSDAGLRQSALHLLSSFLFRWFCRQNLSGATPGSVARVTERFTGDAPMENAHESIAERGDAGTAERGSVRGAGRGAGRGAERIGARNAAVDPESGETGRTPAGRMNRVHIEKALAMMEKTVRENLLVEDFADRLGLSDEHFIRIFRDEVHMTPHQYFIRLKVEGASGLLISTDKTVGEISDWFGFENQFHFSRVFRKCTGMSPVEYRKTYLQMVDFT